MGASPGLAAWAPRLGGGCWIRKPGWPGRRRGLSRSSPCAVPAPDLHPEVRSNWTKPCSSAKTLTAQAFYFFNEEPRHFATNDLLFLTTRTKNTVLSSTLWRGRGGGCNQNTAAEHVAGLRKEPGRMRVRSPDDTQPSPCFSALAGWIRRAAPQGNPARTLNRL